MKTDEKNSLTSQQIVLSEAKRKKEIAFQVFDAKVYISILQLFVL
jgi:hypothetical protein